VVLIQVFGLSFPVFKDLWYGNVANLARLWPFCGLGDEAGVTAK
jgi:hypothetical protein